MKFEIKKKFLCLILTACKIPSESNKTLLSYCTLIFSMSCRIASVTSYLVKTRLNIYKMVKSILLNFLTLKWDISRTIWCIEVNDSSSFCIFHALSFESNFFPPKVPFKSILGTEFFLTVKTSHTPHCNLVTMVVKYVTYHSFSRANLYLI